jgi:hypothetical protein
LARCQLRCSPPSRLVANLICLAIEGFFTVSGTRRYELFGHGITLATRYESLRKIIPLLAPGRHLLTVQTKVIERLAAPAQAEFSYFDLQSTRVSVRDDSEAAGFYYQIVEPAIPIDTLARA